MKAKDEWKKIFDNLEKTQSEQQDWNRTIYMMVLLLTRELGYDFFKVDEAVVIKKIRGKCGKKVRTA